MKNSQNSNSEKDPGNRIPEKDREKILNEWNATEKDYPLHLCLHQIIESQADKTPQRTALSFDGVLMSYRQMNEKANRLAHFLIKNGIKDDSLVGVCMERSFEMVVSLLASIKSGGAYVPFDPEYPQKRLDFIAEDCKARIILTQEKFKKKLAGVHAKIVCVDKEDFSQYPCTNTNIDSDVKNSTDPDSLAYVIYTSGSTGNPKGAMNIHRAIVNRLYWMQETYGLNESDTVVQKTPYSFDVSVWEFFWPLMFGARLAITKPEGHKDTEYLTDFIIREKVTVMHFVPSMLRIFLEDKNINKIKSLRDVIVSGEALPFDLQETFFQKLDSRLHNLYGPTEAAIDVTFWQCQKNSNLKIVPIGRPIANIQMYILNDNLQLLPVGETGELHIGGIGLARGYLNRPELTEEKFISNPFSKEAESRLYKTGDLARYLPDGNIEYLGRIDFQVKIRGFRIELGEIESLLSKHPSIKNCAVMAREDTPGDKRLVAYIVPGSNQLSVSGLQLYLKDKLPEYMIPAAFVSLPSLPLSHNGKIDRKALPKPEKKRPDLAQQYFPPTTDLEKKLEKLWCRLLMIDRVGTDDSYFDLGGNSIQVIQMVSQFNKEHGIEIPIAKVFQYPTIRSLAEFIENRNNDKSDTFFQSADDRATRQRIGRFSDNSLEDGVAIIGMTGRFPGANNIEQLWKNLVNGVESISFFSPEELGPGIDEDLKNDPDYVRARGIIEDADKFDAKFFGISPSEAKVMDPQQRVFLELCWAALENAGYDPDKFKGMIGVYAGVGDNHYYPVNLLSHPDLLKMVGNLIVGYGNEKDYIATRVSYQLNLTGPSVSANTGCSTSLLSVDNAFRALIDYECDMALAGGVDIYVPQKSGQLFQQGGTFCKDGHCRPFDHKADGTMFCDGAGVVVLKRLKDALADNDRIYATIRATAKNNDGANKMSFLAPSVEGQAQVVAMAQSLANINPESISYIEAHGTGTPVGDPIEIEALTKVFGAKTDKKQFCLIGSIKGNVGHPTIASGVAGLIKAALCLYHEKIPPTLHYRKPNPKIDFEKSPFKVVDKLTEWPRSSSPRIAGVSSFGFGGTNVHAIVEEAPVEKVSDKPGAANLLLVSGKTEQAMDRSTEAIKDFIDRNKDVNLSDAAYTLQVGRKYFGYRRFVVAKSAEESIEVLGSLNPNYSGTKYCDIRDPEVIFMFPGQGSQYVNMGRNLYNDEPLFRRNIDTCSEILSSYLDRDLRELLYPESNDEKTSYESLKNTYYTQPAIFTIEYSLSRLWMSWGITPSACIGHSIGEFVCACLAGVFSLEDALRLIALRGRLMRDLPPGSMLSLRCASDEIVNDLPPDIQLAASNGPSLCVVSGPTQEIKKYQEKMEKENVICRHLHTSHAFHSAMMDPIVEPYIKEVKKAKFSKPSIPFMSTVTSQWITDHQATDPEYWGKHLRMPVLFSHGIKQLCTEKKENYTIFLEVGPRTTLTTLARQQLKNPRKQTAVASLSDTHTDNTEWTALLGAVGHLWLNGKTIDWNAFYRNNKRNRIPLPTYQFERKSYWVDPVPQSDQPKILIPREEHTQQKQQQEDLPEITEHEDKSQSRLEKITDELHIIFTKTAEMDVSEFDNTTSFLEMGMDSLFLTQIAFELTSVFGKKFTFGQLMKDFPNVKLLSEHLDKTLPRDMFSTTANQSVDGSSNEDIQKTVGKEPVQPASYTGTIEQVIKEQAETISRLTKILERAGIPGEVFVKKDMVSAQNTDDDDRREYAKSMTQEESAGSIPRDNYVTASEPQRGIWLSSQLKEEFSCAYNESMYMVFEGRLNIQAMRRAIEGLYERHDALRAIFNSDGTSMYLRPSMSIEIPLTDISEHSQNRKEQIFQKLLRKESSTSFDLEKGPLFRSKIICINKEKYCVTLTSHHIVCDGWALDVLISDLCILYNAFNKKVTPDMKPVKSYGSYITQLNERRKSDEFAESRKFWLNKYSGDKTILNLPTDSFRQEARNIDAIRLDKKIDVEILKSLRQVSKKAGCSFFATVLSGLYTYFYRVSAQNEFVIGLPTAGQPVVGQNDLVGHCVNLIPFSIGIKDNQKFIDFLKNVQSSLFESYDHQEYTLIDLLKEMQPPVQSGKVPFAPIGLTSVKRYERDELRCEGLNVDYFANKKCYESFEIYFNAVESKDSLEFTCHFNTAIFNKETVQCWLNELEVLLRGIAANPETTVSDLPVLTEEEEKLIKNKLENTGKEIENSLGIHHLFENNSVDTPDKKAVTIGDKSITYDELNKNANRIANYLLKLKTRTDSRIGISSELSIEMVLTIIAALKSGSTFIIIDENRSIEQIYKMIDTLDIEFAFLNRSDIGDKAKQVVSLDTLLKDSKEESEVCDNPALAVSPEILPFCLQSEIDRNDGINEFLISHKNMLNLIISMKETLGITRDDTILSVSPCLPYMLIINILFPLCTGTSLVLADKENLKDSEELKKEISGNNISVIQATPTLWKQMIELGLNSYYKGMALSGGERLTPVLAEKIKENGNKLWNLSGSGETSGWYSIQLIDSLDKVNKIGYPVANTQIHILDSNLHRVPCGCIGQLFVSGDCLAKQKNSEKESMFYFQGGKRLFKTGDLAKRKSDGTAEYISKILTLKSPVNDNSVYRFIETYIYQYPGIQNVAVITKNDSAGKRKLVAYYTSSMTNPCRPEELKNYLRKYIPDYLVPDSIFMVKSFSFKDNGSIDIDKLLESDGKLIISRQTVNYRDDVEKKLLDIWKRVFDNNSISINDNFFELGGHSLLAGQIYSEIEKVLGKAIPLTTLFKSPTVSQLASVLRDDEPHAVWNYLVPIQPRGKTEPLFLIPGTNGNIQIYHECAKYMGDDIPVYSLKSVGQQRINGHSLKFEDIAAKYIKEIRAFQPSGPYNLGGYCVGGTIALEVAQQIIEQGEKINYLAMIENYNISSLQNLARSRIKQYYKFLELYFNKIDVFSSKNDKKLIFRIDKNQEKSGEFQFSFKRNFSLFGSRQGKNQNTEFENEKTREAYIKALLDYKPQSYPGIINLFISGNNLNGLSNSNCGWDDIAEKGVVMHNIETLPKNVRPELYLKNLAKKLKMSLFNLSM